MKPSIEPFWKGPISTHIIEVDLSVDDFSIRRDRNGLRPVYNLGNERGQCPNGCKFCDVGRSPKVSSEDNLKEFNRQHAGFLGLIDDLYHPLIYNQGNATNKQEFSRDTLEHVLNTFRGDRRIVFVSLNSRQKFVTSKLLEFIQNLDLTYPIHFIFGLESLSPRAIDLFGKDTSGEFDHFNEILRPINQQGGGRSPGGYRFGLDVNLVYLPEMYLPEGTGRAGNKKLVSEGIRWDLQQLLERIDPFVPVEINLHPYYRVDSLPYEDMGLDLLMGELPTLQDMVDDHNQSHPGNDTHLFIGVEGSGYDHPIYRVQLSKWKKMIDLFNAKGVLPQIIPNGDTSPF